MQFIQNSIWLILNIVSFFYNFTHNRDFKHTSEVRGCFEVEGWLKTGNKGHSFQAWLSLKSYCQLIEYFCWSETRLSAILSRLSPWGDFWFQQRNMPRNDQQGQCEKPRSAVVHDRPFAIHFYGPRMATQTQWQIWLQVVFEPLAPTRDILSKMGKSCWTPTMTTYQKLDFRMLLRQEPRCKLPVKIKEKIALPLICFTYKPLILKKLVHLFELQVWREGLGHKMGKSYQQGHCTNMAKPLRSSQKSPS